MANGSRSITESLLARPVILVIGNFRSWSMAGRDPPRIAGFHFVAFHDLTAQTLAALRPELVLSPLMGEDFDAVDLVRRLQALGFAGAYRAVTDTLPDPRGVVAELRGEAPQLDVDLFILARLRPV